MMKKYSLIFLAFLCFSWSGYGQTEIFNLAGGGVFPADWTGTNNVTGRPIDESTYYHLQPGNPGDIIETASYNLSAYTSATFEVDIRSYGSGEHSALLVEVSTDGGATFTQSYTTPVTTTEYATHTINIPTVSANTVLRLSVNSFTGKGIRLRNLVLTAFGASGPTITTSPTALTGLDYVETLGPSAEQTFNVQGVLLTNDITLSAPTNFEISTTSGSGFGPTITLTESGGTVNTTTIYTRLIAGLTVNTYIGDITATSAGATTKTVSLEGIVTLTGGSNCNELFISEYVEGSGNNKYIEIYNPTNAVINISGYSLALYSNGSASPSSTQALSGTIPPYGTIVYANSSANIYTGAVTTTSVCNFNGDDAIALLNGSSYIDIIGTIGEDPGSAWTGSDGRSTENKTIRRNSSVQNGVSSNPVTGFPTFNSEWEVYNQDDISGLGAHLSDCEVPSPELQLVDESGDSQSCGYTIDFGDTGSNFDNPETTFDIKNVGTEDLVVSALNLSGTNAGEFSIISPVGGFTVSPGGTQTVTIQFTPTSNGYKTAELTISNNDSNEGTCVVNLTGNGVPPTPEIRVETNSGNNIPNGAGIAVAYNNTFAATIEGQTSASKTYFIVNLGTGNLDLSSITVSTTEFTIISNPAPTTLAPGDSAPVTIVFNPSSPGVKNAIVTINNNDVTPYTFAVRGTGICGSSTMISTPNSGPVGTVITLTDNSTDISTATVTLNGTALATTVINTNEIEVIVPAGAQTGNLVITNNFGCSSSFLFNVIDKQIGGCEGSATLTDIFISEVTDATLGGLTYIELYNGTGSTVNLSDYSIGIYNNGDATPINTVNLTGSMAHNTTFVVAIGATTNPSTNNSCPVNGNGELADQVFYVGGINMTFDEHDALRLLKSSGTVVVDAFGVYESNNWMDSVHTPISGDRGFNFRRLNTASPLPNPTFDDNNWLIIDWAGKGASSCGGNDYSDIGTYDFSTGVPPSITAQPNLPTTNCDITASISVTAEEGFTGGNPLTYQWYYSAPGDSGWTEVSNGALYSGATASTLDILDAINLNDYQYYCQVREDSNTCYTASNAVRLHIERTVWDGSSWSNSAPDINTIAYLDGNYTTSTDGSFSACQLIINAGNTLNVGDGDYVNVNLNVTNNGTFHIENNGSLVQIDDSGVNTGNISMLRDTQIRRLDYVYWSSPVSGFNVNNISPGSPTSLIFRWGPTTANANSTQGDWVPAAGEIMAPGVGYIVRGPSSYTNTAAVYTAEFNNGVPFNGLITLNVSRGDISANEDDDWNLLGNPYPSAINAIEFLNNSVNTSVLDGFVNIWTHGNLPSNAYADPFYQDFVYNYTANDYITYNASGTSSGPSTFNGNIAAGQGFMVNMKNGSAATQQIEFRNDMRDKSYDNSQFYRNGGTEKHRVWLDLISENQSSARILVGYVENATHQRDRLYDAITDNQNFYSLINNEKFVIQGRGLPFTDTDVIPLGVNITKQGNHTIAIAFVDGLFETENQTVYLKDNVLGIVHNLNENPYSFNSDIGEFNDRFEIVFNPISLSIDDPFIDSNAISIIEFPNGDVQFSVAKHHSIKHVEILDVTGRRVYNLKGRSSVEVYDLSNLSQAAYIAKITLSNGQVISKKAVKQR
ncbi:ASPM-SPD-2-Hydin domain-containing protein [Winogradskyella epiphytica]|uniref:ASPM-SPD-2-Hydin domain-containing protein n=1 Tax=Winogradskyella epiphytica TaxID=262005 RepID=A0A2V4XWD3_9FLAO|nr:choice-of-anchor D domain-containing protein [Winogradskyella epiphytica]PYE83117.1 ASPM-SPD-2-Hydin domain-containing protein [Winogradskyella epiphytica]GGW55908.1 hypothetical protein GCM10008085_04150 [Winogradskyella epiphytica]